MRTSVPPSRRRARAGLLVAALAAAALGILSHGAGAHPQATGEVLPPMLSTPVQG